MPRESEVSTIQRDFILTALRENIRVDGRRFEQFRNLELEFGDEYGTVTLRLGKTRFVVVVKYGNNDAKNGEVLLTRVNSCQGPCADIGRSHQAAGGAQV